MTRHRTVLERLRRDERGMALVWVAVGFMTFLAASTLAIDVGMLMGARSQAQASADAGALAGATAFVYEGFDQRSSGGPVVQGAINTAQKNIVMNGQVSVTPPDVTFPTGPSGLNNRVKVDVFRTADRQNPVANLIAPIFGTPFTDIRATATAEATPADSMTCVKPFIIPDRWQENRTPPFNSQTSTFDRYDKKGNLLNPADAYNPPGTANYTGYTIADAGTPMTLRAGTGSNIEPSSYFSWKMPGDIGGNFYSDNISGCNQSVISAGYDATQEPGNMVGPTISGLQILMDKDPDAYWDPVAKKVVSQYNPSPRLFPIPLYDPDIYQQNVMQGRTAVYHVTAFLPFFLTSVSGNSAYGLIAGRMVSSVRQTNTTSNLDSLIFTIRLVQ